MMYNQKHSVQEKINPKVTIIIVNFNSRTKWNIVKQCLKGILSLQYKPIEILIVDNGSNDGSYNMIRELLRNTEKKSKNAIDIKIIRLSKNYGFAAANYIAFKLRSSSSRYIALINNDLVPEPNSLSKLVDILEKHPRVAGIQGKILSWDGKYIDSYGCIATDNGLLYAVGRGLPHSCISKPVIVTYVDGAYSVYRVEALERCGGLFLPYFFMWGDDYELGIRLWRCGYILVSVPIIVGRHYRGASIKAHEKMTFLLEYWSWVSNIAVMIMFYGTPWLLQLLKRIPSTLLVSAMTRRKAILRGFIDGVRIGAVLRKRILVRKFSLEVAKEPRLRAKVLQELTFLFKLYLKYGMKTSCIYYLVISKSLGRKYCK